MGIPVAGGVRIAHADVGSLLLAKSYMTSPGQIIYLLCIMIFFNIQKALEILTYLSTAVNIK